MSSSSSSLVAGPEVGTAEEKGMMTAAAEDDTMAAMDQKRASRKKKLQDGTVAWAAAEMQIEGVRSFDLEEKLASKSRYPAGFVKTMLGKEVSVAHFQKEGFNNPIHVPDKTDLDLKMPSAAGKTFGVQDIRSAVGSRRCVDVIDCRTQKNLTMTMKDWHRYFEEEKEARTSILNVISLEFSNTKLDSQVSSPRVVRQLDWIDKAWPRHLKDMQTEATNTVEDMMYPKVQKYCLMSVEKCYTDFHIDFGGSSVW